MFEGANATRREMENETERERERKEELHKMEKAEMMMIAITRSS